MEAYPAIDLRGGRCVRLVEGDFDRETVYSDDPVEVLRHFTASGASWVHVVDLDAARSGVGANRELISRMVAAATVPVQVGGGVRTLADAEELFFLGVTRVVVGTAAVENPQLVSDISARWPGRVAVGLDHRDGQVMLRGWVEGGGRRVIEMVDEVMTRGAVAVIVTDISRDGKLAGPDVVGLAGLLEATGAPIIASGGVSGLDDLRLLGSIRGPEGKRLAGVIFGRAIYDGRLRLGEAIAALGAMDDQP